MPILTRTFTILFAFLCLGAYSQNQYDGTRGGNGRPSKSTDSNPNGMGRMPQGMGGNVQTMMNTARVSIGHVYGKIIDSQTKKGSGYTSVSLYTMGRDSLVAGQLTEDNGDFSFNDLPFGAYNLKVTYIGYSPIKQKVIVTPNKVEQDVGDIIISPDVTKLKEVTVMGEKSTMELKIDRKVFNVGKDISARGGTGLDVMKNIPSVSIDADGGITLRNNTPQVYVDGKPTTLSIDQIPADQIDKIEVITNPSAKFEAASSGGIINVVLKKNTKPGYNGMVNLSVGTNNQYNGLGLLNLKEKKWGLSLSYGINSALNRTMGYTDRENLKNSEALNYFHQDNSTALKRTNQFARVGIDWYINNRNTLSVYENLGFITFSNNETQLFNTLDAMRAPTTNGNRVNTQDNSGRNFTTGFNFKHTYPKEGKEFTIDLNYNRSHNTNTYLYTTSSYDPLGSLSRAGSDVQHGDGWQYADMLTGTWDFSFPLRKGMKIETGVRSSFKRTFSYLAVTDSNYALPAAGYRYDPSLSNNYRIDDLVNAAYVTFAQQVKKFGYQAGMRVEQTYYNGRLIAQDKAYSYQYPRDVASVPKMLFPSLNLSYRRNEKNEFQLNFSRKINRPNFFQISPFIFYSDKFNYRIGNPNLKPEFINQIEGNYNLTLNKFSWLSSVYYKYTEQPITGYIYPSDSTGTILINTFSNGTHSSTYGWENIIKLSPIKKLDITLSANAFNIQLNGYDSENKPVSRQGLSWVGKAMVSYKLPWDITIQATVNYESPRVILQGSRRDEYEIGASLNKDFGFVSVNFSVNDILNSKRNLTHYDTDAYIQDISRRREGRYAKLGVSFKFGKLDASLFKKKKTRDTPASGGEDF